jgi:hypothetical protein
MKLQSTSLIKTNKVYKSHGNVVPIHLGIKCEECEKVRHKAYNFSKRKNHTTRIMNLLEPKGTIGDAIRRNIYASIENKTK